VSCFSFSQIPCRTFSTIGEPLVSWDRKKPFLTLGHQARATSGADEGESGGGHPSISPTISQTSRIARVVRSPAARRSPAREARTFEQIHPQSRPIAAVKGGVGFIGQQQPRVGGQRPGRIATRASGHRRGSVGGFARWSPSPNRPQPFARLTRRATVSSDPAAGREAQAARSAGA